MAQPRVIYHWRDNNDKRAEIRVYLSGPQTYDAIVARAAAMASVFQAASDARLAGYDIEFPLSFDGATPAEPGSDARSYALLFYRNDERVAAIRLPSPGRLPVENAGPYAGYRYTRSDVAMSGLLVSLETIAALLVDGLGRPYPTTFSVGGRVEL